MGIPVPAARNSGSVMAGLPARVQAELKVDTYQEAIAEFPAAMQKALAEVIQKLKQMQQQKQQQQNKGDSRIIVPGR